MNIDISQRNNFILRWASMLDRCDNPNNKNYENYGGRGIKVCKEWYDFFKYLDDLPEGYFKKAQLDRIDNNLGYFKENVRWVTRQDNCKNRRSNRNLTKDGETLGLSEWALRLEINPTTLSERIERWGEEKALSLPKGSRLLNKNGEPIKYYGGKPRVGRFKNKYTYNGIEYNLQELSDISGVSKKLLAKRINERGWTVERAVETKN